MEVNNNYLYWWFVWMSQSYTAKPKATKKKTMIKVESEKKREEIETVFDEENRTDGDVLAIHEQARFAALFIFDIFDSVPKKYPADSQF